MLPIFTFIKIDPKITLIKPTKQKFFINIFDFDEKSLIHLKKFNKNDQIASNFQKS